ncbi:MAG: SIMPL domain-containing protein [Thermomicrobiales bacterium]
MGFDQVGVGFTVAGCAAIEHQALADAVTNGRSQAEGLSKALGVTLGNLVQASRQPVYGYDGAAATSSCDALPSLDLARETYLPPFNPTQAPEVELYVQVNLTYASRPGQSHSRSRAW